MTNAAQIAHAYTTISEGASFFNAIERVTQAACLLADIECEPGFEWDEDPRGDWETCCHAIAVHISSGFTITAAAVRRIACD